MPNTLDIARPVPRVSEMGPEAWAVCAGKGLGQFDKAEGVFDDTPPSGVSAAHEAAYRSAYCAENPGYAYL
jgi:hypothetical protein